MNSPLSFEESTSSSKRWFHGWCPNSPLRQLIDEIPELAEGQRGLVRTHLPEVASPDTKEKAVGLLSVKRQGSRLVFNQVPGIHDVTADPELGIPSAGIAEDPFINFSSLLQKGFCGGYYCNVFVVEPPHQEHWAQCQYTGRPKSKGECGTEKIVISQHEKFFGDRYRLLLWTGFSRNFTSLPDKPTAYATVHKCHPMHIEPYVVFDSTTVDRHTMHERIEQYRQLFGHDLLRFVDRGNNWQTVTE